MTIQHPSVMNTRAPSALAIKLALDVGTPSELAQEWARQSLLTIWNMHGAQRHAAARRKAQAAARCKLGLVTDGAARMLAAELDRRRSNGGAK